MISETAKVSMDNGGHLPSIEVYPGRKILTPKRAKIGWKLGTTAVCDRRVSIQTVTETILFRDGGSLTMTPDHTVGVQGKILTFKAARDLWIGDMVIGEKAGMKVSRQIVAKTTSTEPLRCVGFQTDGAPYLAEGVLCRG